MTSSSKNRTSARGTGTTHPLVQSLGVAILSSLPAPAQISAWEGVGPTASHSYGPDSLQMGELRIPEGPGPFPVAVLIHGGCWLDGLGEGSMTPAAATLPDAGIATWNIEYRRLGHDGGGWPGTFLDVGAGLDHLRVLSESYPLDLDRIVTVGHSSGAHLAVWAAGRPGLPTDSEIRGSDPLSVRAAVGVDGPMDLDAWNESGRDEEICDGPVVARLMGGARADVPVRYRHGSPAQMAPFAAPIYLNPAAMMIAESDGSDPLSARSGRTGEKILVRPVPDSDHFQLITPGHHTWLVVLETIREALGMG